MINRSTDPALAGPTYHLRTRFMILIGGILLITLVGIVASIILLLANSERSSWQGRQTVAAQTAALQIRDFVDNAENNLRFIANSAEEEHLSALIQNTLDTYPGFMDIIAIDAQGRILADVFEVDIEELEEVAFGQFDTLEPGDASDFYYSELELSPQNNPYVIMATRTQDGHIVAAALDMSFLNTIMANIRFGDTGQAYLIEAEGPLIAHSDSQIVQAGFNFAGRPELSGVEDLLTINTEGKTQQQVYRNFQDIMVIGVASVVSDTDWVLFTEVSQEEVAAPVRNAVGVLIAFALVFWAGAIFTTTWIVRKQIFTPLARLSQGQQTVALGDLDHQIEVSRRDEIGVVTEGFNAMVYELHRQVEEREQVGEKLRRLYEVMAQPTFSIDEQLNHALKTGTEILGFELGIISRIEGNTYTVLHGYSPDGSLKAGQVFDFKQTYCELTYQADNLVTISHMSQSTHKAHPCYSAFGLEAYIGVPLQINGKRFGTLNFSSAKPRTKTMASVDLDFFALMGKWVSTVLERQSAEELLTSSEASLRSLLDNTPSIISRSDRENRIEFIRVPGVDPQALNALIGESFFVFVPEAFQARVTQALEQVFEKKITMQYETSSIDPNDGTLHWYATSAAPIIEDGKVVSALLVSNDITERKKAEEKVQALLDAIPDMLFQINTEGIFLDFKAAKALSTVVPPEAFLGKDIRQVLPQLGDRALEAVHKVVETGSEQMFEYSLPENDVLHHFEARMTLSGTDSALVIVRDVTTLKQTAIALEQQRIFLRQVIDFSPNMIFVKDYDGRFVLANPVLAKLYNVSVEELIGKSDADFNPDVKEVEHFVENDRRVIMSGEPLFIEEPVTNANAETHWFQTTKVPIVVNNGGTKYVLGVATDITERRKAEQQINGQNEALVKANRELAISRKQAEAANTLKSQFLATMSHELRTPLNAVIGYAQLQLAGMVGELSDEQYEFQERILVNAQHLLQLINEVLDLSKIEAGRMELAERLFNLRECLEEIMFQNTGLAEDKGLAFKLIIDERLPENIVGDRGRIKQVIINLVSNGIKFTDVGSVSIEAALNNKESWRITVTDTGGGISPTMQENIFDEFRQAENGIERGGTGLGLAIVRKLVLMMGGNIRLNSDIGRGSAFTITLPLITEPEHLSETLQA